MKLGAITFGLTLGAALAGALLRLAIGSALIAFVLVLAFELRSSILVRNDLLQSVRNPIMPQESGSTMRTIKIVPVGMFIAGAGLAVLSSFNPLEGYNYFVAALGGAMIAHAICARNTFSALVKEGALP